VTANRADLDQLSSADRQLLEAWLVEFDQRWQKGLLAERAGRLPPEGHPLRLPALVELVKIDLERCWQCGVPIHLEDYLQRYPELGGADAVSASLVHAEYRARQGCGRPVELAELVRRFPRQAEDLRQLAAEAQETAPGVDPSPAAGVPEQFGRYRILRKLGQGAMGSVYLAEDTHLQRQVALKVPQLSVADSPEALERFEREARAVAALHHPNICPVYDAGVIAAIPYLTMAYLKGQPLSELIAAGQPWPQRQAAALVRQLALALAEAHEHGVIHRDLKPANIMIKEHGDPVIMDFGLARRLDAADKPLTAPGMIVGTPAYMSPEQVSATPEAVGPRCDVYSLGVILYELLTGQLPFRGPVHEVLVQIQAQPPRPPSVLRPDLDPRLEAVCLKALAKSPAERQPTMSEVAAALAAYLEAAVPPTPARSRGGWRLAAAHLAAILPLGGPVRSVRRWRRVAVTKLLNARLGTKVFLVAVLGVMTAFIGIWLLQGSWGDHPVETSKGDYPVETSKGDYPVETSNELRIERISIASDDCMWDNLYQHDQIVGFEGQPLHAVSPVDLELLPSDRLARSSVERQLENWPGPAGNTFWKKAYTYFAGNGVTKPNKTVDESFLGGSYDGFRRKLLLKQSGSDDCLKQLRLSWPSSEELQALQRLDPQTAEILKSFHQIFFRDAQPIFDIIVQHTSTEDVVIHSCKLEMKYIKVVFAEQTSAGGSVRGLEITTQYNWRVTPLSDERFVKWERRSNPGVREILYPSIAKSYFELDPPLTLGAKQPGRFRVRFAEGSWKKPFSMRFIFLYGQQKGVASRWYAYRPTTTR
jgi:serine/threonine protein kinase